MLAVSMVEGIHVVHGPPVAPGTLGGRMPATAVGATSSRPMATTMISGPTDSRAPMSFASLGYSLVHSDCLGVLKLFRRFLVAFTYKWHIGGYGRQLMFCHHGLGGWGGGGGGGSPQLEAEISRYVSL